MLAVMLMRLLDKIRQFFATKALQAELKQIETLKLRKLYEKMAELLLVTEIVRKGDLNLPILKEISFHDNKVLAYIFINDKTECPYPFKVKLGSFSLRYKNQLCVFHAYLVLSLKPLR